MEVADNLRKDTAWAKLAEERELTPSAHVKGPELARILAGEPDPNDTAAMVREYVIPRGNLSKAADMVPGIQEMLEGHKVNITMWVPVIAEDMKRLLVVYSAPDLKTLGKGTDEVGMTEKFQKMLVEASKLGTLDRSFGMVQVD